MRKQLKKVDFEVPGDEPTKGTPGTTPGTGTGTPHTT
jgi:hypothetical protein